MTTVGIPRGLLYYKYYPLWSTFLENLGIQVVTSPSTNKKIFLRGLNTAESEVCLPVKVFYGHVLELKDQVDFLFIPRIVSVEGKAYTCPKFLGLPDMIKAVENTLPPILNPTFNAKKGIREYYLTFYNLGRKFTQNSIKIAQAFLKARKAQSTFNRNLLKGELLSDILEGGKAPNQDNWSGLRVGLAGHPYNIFDSYVSLNLIKKLKEKEVKIVTGESVPHRRIEKETKHLPKKLFWTYEKEVVGSILYWLKEKVVDGIVYLLSFACGPDSLIQVLIEDESKKFGMPLMPLTIDEHSGEAGLVTRLEAFLDMLARRKRRK